MNRNFTFKRMFVIGVLVVAGIVHQAAPLRAEDKPTGDVTAAALSGYVWRGYELSRDSLVIQPSLTLGYKGFSVNVWGNLDTKPYSTTAEAYPGTWNETDLTLSYSKSLGLVNVGGGYIYYSLAPLHRNAAYRNDSQELFATASLNTLLSPTLTVYKEIDHYRNWYFLFGVSHAFELGKMAQLKLAASASYLIGTDADTYPKFDSSATATTDKFSNLHDGSVSASLPLKLTDQITVTPMLSYIFPLSDDAKNEMRGFGLKGTASAAERDSAFLVGGLSVSFSF